MLRHTWQGSSSTSLSSPSSLPQAERATANANRPFSAAMASKGIHHPGQSREHLPDADGWRGTDCHCLTEAPQS